MTTEPETVLCIFCDDSGERSEEDLISKWIDRKLRARANGNVQIVLSQRRVDGDIVEDLGRDVGQSYSAIKIPDVCKTCNNGWMSSIDNNASRVLKPMLDGIRIGLPPRDQKILARWLALKTLVADRMDDRNPAFSPDDYHAFYASRNPPERFRAALGYLGTGTEDVNYYSLEALKAADDYNAVKAGEMVAQQYFFSIRPVLFHVGFVNLRGQGYHDVIQIEPNPYWTLIWPPRSPEVNWPPPRQATVTMLPKSIGVWKEHDQWVEQYKARRAIRKP